MLDASRQLTASILASLSVAAPMLCFGSNANASENATRTIVALDVDYVAAVSEPDASGGGGGAVRLGRKLDLI